MREHSRMGFNRRKMEDQRRQAAEKVHCDVPNKNKIYAQDSQFCAAADFAGRLFL